LAWFRRAQPVATADAPSAGNGVRAASDPEPSYRALALEPPPAAPPPARAEAGNEGEQGATSQPRAAESEAVRKSGGGLQRARAVAARPPRPAQNASTDTIGARPESCDPPTYVGKDGIRHFKMSCL
jgi:hypothetical protein